jgi:DNA-binding NarL/FixJ family response regulator
LIADEDATARSDLARLLEDAGYEVVEATCADDAVRFAHEQAPCLSILEVVLGSRSGYELCRQLHDEFGTDFPVVFLSGTRTESYDRVAGLLVGADDYIVKPYAPDELLARIRRLLERHGEVARSGFDLTAREREVLELLADGLLPGEIAERLVISRKTVGTHIEHLFRKLDVRSRAQAIAVAYREGLVGGQR